MATEYLDVLVRFPKLETADAADLQKLFPHRDGVWSDLIRAGRSLFEVEKVDLNENWAAMSMSWRCRGCDREKFDCLRVSPESKVLMAHLEEHHDHLADRPQDLFRERFGKKWVAVEDKQFGYIELMLKRLIQRFNPTLVCKDCNGADAAVQAKYKLPKHFSFTPREIRQFITPKAHEAHIVDYPKAYALYEGLCVELEKRMALLDYLIDMAAEGYLQQERGVGSMETNDWDLRIDRHLYKCHQDMPSSPVGDIERDLQAFKSLSLSRDAAGQSTKRKVTKLTALPTDEEFEQHDGNGDPDLWNLADVGWSCPGCHRTKYQTLKASKKKGRKWSSKLFRHSEFIWGNWTDPFTDEQGPGITHVESHLLCQDCASIGGILKAQEPQVNHLAFRLQLDDIAAISTVEPHAAHIIDRPQAVRRAVELAKRHTQIDAFERHCMNAANRRTGYLEALEEANGNMNLAFSRQIQLWITVEKMSYVETETRLRVLIREADRLDAADPGLRYVRRYPPLASLTCEPTHLPSVGR